MLDYDVGDIVSGKDIAKQSGRYIYACCPFCHYTRWIAFRTSAPNQKTASCTSCRNEKQKNSSKEGKHNVR